MGHWPQKEPKPPFSAEVGFPCSGTAQNQHTEHQIKEDVMEMRRKAMND